MSPATLLAFPPSVLTAGSDQGPTRVTLFAVMAGRHQGLVEVEGFEFRFTAEAAGPDVWISFAARRGLAGEVFARWESELRAAARQAVRSRQVA